MPKKKNSPLINLNLLKPQSNPEKIFVKLMRWLLSSGRYIFVFVEGLVLIAFIARFKFDADLAAKKEAIEEQIPYIESLKPYEILIRNTQLKLGSIDNIKKNSPDWGAVLKRISELLPQSMKITSINMTKKVNNTAVSMVGQTQNNTDLTGFVGDLKADSNFNGVNITNLGLEEGVIKFTIEAYTKVPEEKEKKL